MDVLNPSPPARVSLRAAQRAAWQLLSLRQDQADPAQIDATVRDNSRLAGTNLWVLMLAIVIASVGLNVNSTAVIIGAMLISPLMGPIIGIGYGAGVVDYRLIRRSLANLAAFTGISLIASTAYFALSPLTQAHSELLARTSPTLWDVLIAFFGGAAGMIGLTRKEKTTLIPGVAIATALMPPLCTAGYGLATGQPLFFFGAFYLFLINGVFIALASLAIVRLLRLPRQAQLDAGSRSSARTVVFLAVAALLVPSVWLASRLVRDEVFTANAERFVHEAEQSAGDVVLLGRQIDPQKRSITLTLMGKGVTPGLQQTLENRLAAAGLAGATLRIRHPSQDPPVKVDALKRDLRREVLQGALGAVDALGERVDRLERAQAAVQAATQARAAELAAAQDEIRAQLPSVRGLFVADAPTAGSTGAPTQMLVAIDPLKRLTRSDLDRLKRWLKVRWPAVEVQLIVGHPAV